MSDSTKRRLRSPLDIAEVATAGVRYNLAVGDDFAASALQLVARAAWALVDDPEETEALGLAVETAQEHLRMTCGMSGERRFLDDVRGYLAGTRADDDPGIPDGDDPGDAAFPEPPEADGPDPLGAQRLAAVAAEYLRAAAVLSEASVLFLTACTAVATDPAGAVPVVDGVFTRVPALLEAGANSYSRLVDLLAFDEAARSPDARLHLDELRLEARTLQQQAAAMGAPEPFDPDDPEDDQDEFTSNDLIDLLSDRAETYRDRATVLTEYGELAARRAWELGAE